MRTRHLTFLFCLLLLFSTGACSEEQSKQSVDKNGSEANIETMKNTPASETAPVKEATDDPFFDFVSMFPDQMAPFSSKDLEFSSYIDSAWVQDYLDGSFAGARQADHAESQTSEEAEEEYYPLNYVYGGRVIVPGDFYCLIWYGQREGIGPAEKLGISTFSESGEKLAELILDASNVLSAQSTTFVIESNKISITTNGQAINYKLGSNGDISPE